MENEKKKIGITLRPDVATGKYANLAIISHTKNEFVVDFATMLPGLAGPDVHSRIVMQPENCKRLLNALADNIRKYEAVHGTIELTEAEQPRTINLADIPTSGTKS